MSHDSVLVFETYSSHEDVCLRSIGDPPNGKYRKLSAQVQKETGELTRLSESYGVISVHIGDTHSAEYYNRDYR